MSSYRQRRDTVIGLLGKLEMTAFRPAGAFHTWVDISGSGVGAREFALALLAQERVAVAPGTAFGRGGAGFVRVSLAASEPDLVEGATRLANCWRRSAAAHSAQQDRPVTVNASPDDAATQGHHRRVHQRELF